MVLLLRTYNLESTSSSNQPMIKMKADGQSLPVYTDSLRVGAAADAAPSARMGVAGSMHIESARCVDAGAAPAGSELAWPSGAAGASCVRSSTGLVGGLTGVAGESGTAASRARVRVTASSARFRRVRESACMNGTRLLPGRPSGRRIVLAKRRGSASESVRLRDAVDARACLLYTSPSPRDS